MAGRVAEAGPVDYAISSEDDERSRLLFVAETKRPDGADTQWLAFRFRSDGLLSNSPGSHFAIVLRAALDYGADGLPVAISGRGIALGDTSQAHPPPGHPLSDLPGFGGARGMGIESFWPGGNFLFAASAVLPQGLQERFWYHVVLHVNDARWVAFRVTDEHGQLLHPEPGPCVRDAAAHPVRAGATGVLIALGRDRRENGPWRAAFRDIRHGWFAAAQAGAPRDGEPASRAASPR